MACRTRRRRPRASPISERQPAPQSPPSDDDLSDGLSTAIARTPSFLESPMSIPLPIPAWHVSLTLECNYYNSPLGDEFDKYNMGIHEIEFPELYVSGDFDGKKLKKDPRVVRMEAVWVICPYDFTRPYEEIDGLEIHSYFGEQLGGK